MWVSQVELAGLLGEDMAETLCKYKGGVEFYVPHSARATHELSKIVGVKGMEALCWKWPGEFITVPCHGVQKTRVLQLLAEGKTRAAVARECGVSERYVYMLASIGQEPQAVREGGQLTLPL